MSIGYGIAVYFIIWWLVLFIVLPFGIKTQAESGDIVEGSAESAPVRPMLVRKAVITTIISGFVFAGIYAAVEAGYGLDDISF